MWNDRQIVMDRRHFSMLLMAGLGLPGTRVRSVFDLIGVRGTDKIDLSALDANTSTAGTNDTFRLVPVFDADLTVA